MSGTSRYCSRCGAPVPEGAAFCPRCGNPVGAAVTPPPAPSRPREYRYEKQEKEEKHEKREKSEKSEKGRGGNLLGAVVGGLILIWLGVTFYYAQTGVIGSSVWWAYFILGIGVILVVQGLILAMQSRRTFAGPIIGGAILALIGYGFIAGLSVNLWPLILVVIGIFVILTGISARRRAPSP